MGMAAASIGDELGQSSEALEGVGLLAKTLRREGVPSPTLDRLVALVDGRIEPEAFTAHADGPRRAPRRDASGAGGRAPRATAAAPAARLRTAGEKVALAGVTSENGENGRATRPG